MEFRILGPLDVRNGDQAVELAGGRQRALLALLIVNANETVSTDRIVEELWGEQSPQTAPKVVQNHVSQLRRGLGDGLLVTEGSGYRLRIDPGSLDVDRFEELLADGRNALERGDAESAADLLRQALALWRGTPLADVSFEPFAQAEIARLEERRLVAVEERIEADLALRRQVDLVGELEALIARNPLRERPRAQLMLALYRSGRQSEALAAYQEARKTLVEELGIEPGRPLRELHQAVLNQDPGLDLPTADGLAGETTRGAFVGREEELADLMAGLDDAIAGHGRLFLLVGEPGIGKSRLAEELTAVARARGTRVLVGRCWEAGGAPAYWPWVQALRAYVREADPDELRAAMGAGAPYIAQIIPELRVHFPDLPDPPARDSEGARFRLFDAASEFVHNASQSRPIVLVLDDLHAADTPSLLLLQFLARELGSMRMLVLGAYRDVDPIPGEPLAEMLANVVSEPVTRRLRLSGLSERAVAEYIERTASGIASPSLVGALHEETDGNPLFVGEIVRLLAVEGVRSESTPEFRVAIPESIREVIGRRLGHLTDECKRVLVLASVLGREFDLNALAHMAGVSEENLLDVLDEAMAARVVSDVPGGSGRLRFAHVLIRDALYEELTTVRRVRLHRLAVEAAEVVYGDEAGPHLAELAHHAVAGSDFDKGLQYARRAAGYALALLAYEEAARLYVTALDALELASVQDDDEMRCQLLLALGEAQMYAGNTQAGKEAFLKAAGIARRLGLHRELALAAGGYAREDMYLRAGSDRQLAPLLEEGLAALGDEEVELRARLLARLAGALRDELSRDRRDGISREAVALARRTGNLAALAYALDGRVPVIIAPDTIDECLVIADELRELAQQSGDAQRLAHAHLHRVITLLMLGRVHELQPDLETISRIGEELKRPSHLWEARAGQASLALAAGRLTAAEELMAEAFALGERAKPEVAIPVIRLQQYTMSEFRGDLDQLEPAIRELVSEHPARPAFGCALVHLHARIGRFPEARRELAEFAHDDWAALPFDQEWLLGMSLLAETSALLDDSASASTLYVLLSPYAALNVADWPEAMRGSVSRYLGLLATTMKSWDDAEQHFEEGLAMNAECGFLPWLAHTRYDYARMLLERGQPLDSERAEALLASSKTLAAEIGLTALAERISRA